MILISFPAWINQHLSESKDTFIINKSHALNRKNMYALLAK